MSGETNVNVKMEEEKPKKGRGSRLRSWIGGKIAGETATQRMEDTWSRIHQVGGFLPIFVEGRLELRSAKLQTVLDDIEKKFENCDSPEQLRMMMHKSNIKVYTLFHKAGTQWIRGLKDRELAGKVRSYLEFFQRVADNPAFAWDLNACSMEMLNISFLPEDVSSVPPYLIETKTVIQPMQESRIKMEDAQQT